MRHKGVNTSGVPFIFWCLLGISAVVTEYVVAIEKVFTSNMEIAKPIQLLQVADINMTVAS